MITREDLLTPRTLYGIAGAFVVLGLGLRVAPARVPAAQPAHGLPAAAHSEPATVGDERSYTPIAAGNVFSQARTPPKVRFVPEGRSEPAPAPAARQKPRAPALRLYGITAGTIALIDADPKIRGAELYRVGDRVGSGRITSITDSTVVIYRAGGSLILRLPSDRRSRR